MTSKSWWISGPSFLSQRRPEWPKQEILHAQQVKVILFSSVNSTVSNIVDVTRFSSWNKIIRVIALCILFADKCRKPNAEMKLPHFTRAYLYVIHNIQRQDFNPEYMLLKKRIEVSSTSRLKSLSPFLDENNQLRARGRLAKASLLMTARHPIILDGNNAAVKLLVQHTKLIVIVVPSRLETLLWNTIGYFAVEQLLNRLYATVCHVVECSRMLATPRWLIYPRKDYPRKISSSLKQLVSIS